MLWEKEHREAVSRSASKILDHEVLEKDIAPNGTFWSGEVENFVEYSKQLNLQLDELSTTIGAAAEQLRIQDCSPSESSITQMNTPLAKGTLKLLRGPSPSFEKIYKVLHALGGTEALLAWAHIAATGMNPDSSSVGYKIELARRVAGGDAFDADHAERQCEASVGVEGKVETLSEGTAHYPRTLDAPQCPVLLARLP